MKTKPLTLHAKCIQSLNRAGLTDMYGQFYVTSAHPVVSFILRKARADLRKKDLKT